MAPSPRRLELQALLESLLESENVYFQPPNGLSMVYPCIRYEMDEESTQHADNAPYRRNKRYMITIIDRDPDSAIPDKIASLPLCSFNRFYTADNLNHFVYTLYF